MNFLKLVLIVALFQLQANAQNSSKINQLPPPIEQRFQNYDIQHIALDLSFNWKKQHAIGTAAISLKMIKPGDSIFLDAGFLTINSIKLISGKELRYEYDGGDRNNGLKIKLDRNSPLSEIISIVINYHTNYINLSDPNGLAGTDGKGLRFFQPTLTEPKRRKQIWSNGYLFGNKYWFPCFDYPGDLRTTDVKITVDDNLTAISNGKLISQKAYNGVKIFHYKMDIPYPNYLTSVVVGKYAVLEQKSSGVILRNYCYKDEIDATIATVVNLPDMVKFFSDKTGVKYPYHTYSQVFVQDAPWQVENISASTITENMVDDYGTHDDFKYLWDGCEAEALAHQWFGNYVTPRHFNDIWLSRSFAHLFDGLYKQYKYGNEEFLLSPYHLAGDHNSALLNWNSGFKRPINTSNYELPTEFKLNDGYSYSRGALTLNMLRKEIGDEAFDKVVKAYMAINKGRNVTTSDLEKAVSAVTGKSYTWFFDQWIYKMGYPKFLVRKQFDSNTQKLTLQVIQEQIVDTSYAYPQVDFFEGTFAVEIDGKVKRLNLLAKKENTFDIDCSTEPKIVQFDYENTWIKELTFTKTINELIYQLEHDIDITGRRWAMGELNKIAKDTATIHADKLKIYQSFRNVIGSKVYWRLKYSALLGLQSLLITSANTPVDLDIETRNTLVTLIRNERSWVKAQAIGFLGLTHDIRYQDIYINALKDSSDRVVYNAAIALGKTKSDRAFPILNTLISRPSWKNQSLIAALNGFKQLGDKRAIPIAIAALKDFNLKRWSLPTQLWDFRITVAEMLFQLGETTEAHVIIFNRLKIALDQNDINSIFNNTFLIATLANSKGEEAFTLLKNKYKDDANAMSAVLQYEKQFSNAVKK